MYIRIKATGTIPYGTILKHLKTSASSTTVSSCMLHSFPGRDKPILPHRIKNRYVDKVDRHDHAWARAQ